MNHQDFATAETQATFRERPDGSADPAGEAGWFLQRERQRREIDIEQAADETGIHAYHLDAIEWGDLTRLPARMETLRMAGLYAQYLGFDPEPLVYHYAALLPKPQAATQPAHPANPEPLTSAKVIKFGKFAKLASLSLSGFPGGAGGIVASCLVAVLLFGGASWYLQPGPDAVPAQQSAEAIDPMPTASTDEDAASVKITEEAMPDAKPVDKDKEWDVGEAAAPAPHDATVPEDAPAAAIPPQEDFGGMTEFIQDKVGVKPAKEKLPAVAAADAKQTPAASETKSRLVLKAKAPVWVRIEDSHGNVVMTQMLMKGDTYQVPAREGLVLIARDGGLLSYEIDGKERGILGTPGEILVGRPLDITSLEGQG